MQGLDCIQAIQEGIFILLEQKTDDPLPQRCSSNLFFHCLVEDLTDESLKQSVGNLKDTAQSYERDHHEK